MFDHKTILVADAGCYSAMDLAAAIEDNDGRVVGPMASAADALTVLDCTAVGGVVVDCELAGAPALIVLLARAGVPLVVQTSVPLPREMEAVEDRFAVLVRPVDTRSVVNTLANEIARAELTEPRIG